MFKKKTDDTAIEPYSEQYAKITFGETQENTATTVGVETTQRLQANKTYYINTFIFDASDTTDKFLIRDVDNGINLETLKIEGYPAGQILYFTTQGETNSLKFYYFANTRKYGAVNYSKPFYMPKRFIISDKLEDVVNQEFFEGMQSVQMPVLKTVGKNLFDGEIISGKDIDDTKGTVNDSTNHTITSKFTVPKNKNYKVSSNKELAYCIAHYYKNDDTWLGRDLLYHKNNVLNTSLYDYDYLQLEMDGDGYNYIQIEEGSVATAYEPFKSNILTVNEPIELHGIGDVQDKLDFLTGEVTKSIGEIVLDGTQDMDSDGYGVYIQVNDVKRFLNYTDKIACDKLPVISTYWDLENVENGISGFTNSGSYLEQNWLYVKINNSVNTDEVKEWLTQNPITVRYQRVTDSIKTVDLSCVNEQGVSKTFRPIEGTMHVKTSSQTLPPLLDMSVPVEATTQNLMSFANIEGEE